MTAQIKKILPLFLLFFFLSPSGVWAQSALGLSAIPPRIEIKLKPGETVTKEIKVRNESKTEKVVSTTIKDFIVTDDAGTPIQVNSQDLDENGNRWAAASWIQVSPTKVKLKAGETKTLMLTIIAPEDALPGGHYSMIIHSPQNDTFVSETGSYIETNVGTLVYVTIPGDIKEKASIKKFTAPSFSEYGPIDFKTTITNLSDIHITPAGAITITDALGLKVAQLDLNPTNIFPNTSRELTSTLQHKLLFGRFKAQINAAYGTSGQLLTATLFFWVIPYKLIALLLVIVLILILIIKMRSKQTPPTPETPQVEELEKELADLKKKYQDRH